jgi:hypothetical protein
MPKKANGNLKSILEAVFRIKELRENEDGENPEFCQALDAAEKYLTDLFLDEEKKRLMPGKKSAARAKPSEPSIRQN